MLKRSFITIRSDIMILKLDDRDASQTFAYDDGDRLLSIERQPTGIGKQLGITEEKLEYTYDLLGRLTKEITPAGTLGYEYDPLSNLTTRSTATIRGAT